MCSDISPRTLSFPRIDSFPRAKLEEDCEVWGQTSESVFATRVLGYFLLLYSWRFSCHSAPIHWQVHGHMTSNNETVSRQMQWAGNTAKTMTSNGKQFTVTREMLTAVARDRWNPSAVFKFCFCFVVLYNKSFNYWSLGEQSLSV